MADVARMERTASRLPRFLSFYCTVGRDDSGIVLEHHVGFRTSEIDVLPGTRAGAIFSRFYWRRSYERVFEPLIADAQHEYTIAVARGDELHARLIRVRLVASLAATMVAHFAAGLGAIVVRVYRLTGL